MDAAGLETWANGSPMGKIDLVTGDHEEYKKKFCHLLEAAKILGAKNIRLFSCFIPADQDRAQYKEQVIARFRELVKLAEGSGIDLCHENEKGINGLTLSNAMHLSSFTGKPVKLPMDEETFYEELMKWVATSRRKTNVKEVHADTAASFAGTN